MTTKAAFLAAMGGDQVPFGQTIPFVRSSGNILTATAHGLTTGAGPYKIMTDNADPPSGLTAAVASTGTLTFASAVATDVFEINGTTYTLIATPATADDVDVAASDVLQAEVAAAVINHRQAPGAGTYFAGSTKDNAVEVEARAGVLHVWARDLDSVVGDAITISSVDATITASAANLAGGATGTDYYIIRLDATTFSLATSLANAHAGTAVALADAGTGTHELVGTTSTFAEAMEDWLLSFHAQTGDKAFKIARFWNALTVANAGYSD